jgi:hypothetical protein
VLEATGFAPTIPTTLETTPAPTPEELAILRHLDPAGLLRGGAGR